MTVIVNQGILQGAKEGEPAPKQADDDGGAELSHVAATATAPDDQQPAAAKPQSSSSEKQQPQQQSAADKPPCLPEEQPPQQQQPPAVGSQPQLTDPLQQQEQQIHDVMKDGRQPGDKASPQQLPWQLGQAGPECPMLQSMIRPRMPPTHKLQTEYSSLSMADKVRPTETASPYHQGWTWQAQGLHRAFSVTIRWLPAFHAPLKTWHRLQTEMFLIKIIQLLQPCGQVALRVQQFGFSWKVLTSMQLGNLACKVASLASGLLSKRLQCRFWTWMLMYIWWGCSRPICRWFDQNVMSLHKHQVVSKLGLFPHHNESHPFGHALWCIRSKDYNGNRNVQQR